MKEMKLQALQVNGQDIAVGLDLEQIIFSWRIQESEFASSAGRAERQGVRVRSTRVRVATDRSLLIDNKPDIWDSGELFPKQGPHIRYAGPPLQSLSRYWWNVTVITSQGDEFSAEPAWFETGLTKEDWQAQWIWHTGSVTVNDFAYLRKDLQLAKSIAKARLFYSAHHSAQVFINGTRISGYGSPAPTRPDKRKYVLAHDVTALIKESAKGYDDTCCLAAIAHYLGGDGQNYVNALPGFRLQLELWYEDGSRETVVTDESWQTLPQIPYERGTPYQQNRRISAIERFDARKEDPSWNLPGYDAAKCQPAVVAKISLHDWPMKRQEIQEGIVSQYITPVEITPTEIRAPGDSSEKELAGRQVFDTGTIVSGWVRLRLKGIPGNTVQVRYSEDLDEQGFVKHHVCNETSEHYYDEYTMLGAEPEEWEADFSYKAFRYIEITGYPYPIVPGEELQVVYAHTGLTQLGSFRSSSALLNAMYEAAMQTHKNNVLGQVVDCPHREQAQYLADSDLQAEALLTNFDAGAALEKVLSDFADGQLEDGTFPFVYPTNFEKEAFHLQIPEWDLHYCSLLWKLYQYCEDPGLLTKYLGTAKRMVNYFVNTLDEKLGLAPLGKGWHISDWPYPTVDYDSDYLTVQNMKLYYALKVVAEASEITGDLESSENYAKQAERLKDSILLHLYDPDKQKFVSGFGLTQVHQGVNALALHYDLVPEADRQAVLDYVANSPWESKTVLSLPLLRVLFDHGKAEDAYRLIHKEDYPGWGYMIKQGSKTMWEGWDDIESHSHAWNGYPARMMQEYIAGIRPPVCGDGKVRIQPYMPKDLTFAEADITTSRGEISAGWEREEQDGVRVRVNLPHYTEGELVMQIGRTVHSVVLNRETVWERGSASGNFLAERMEWMKIEPIADGVKMMLPPGKYDIRIM